MAETTKRLKELRNEHGLSQEQLAERLGVTRQTVSNWETGITSPNSRVLEKLSQIYGVSPGVLLGEAPAGVPEENVPEPEAPPAPEPTPARRKRRWPCALAAALLAAAIAVGGFFLWRSFNRTVPIEDTKVREVIEPLPPALPLLPPE